MPSIDLDPSLSPHPSPRSLPSSPKKRRSPRAVLGLSNLLLQRPSNIQVISEVALPKPPASTRSSSSSTRRRRKPRGELASVTTLSFFEPDTTVHVENTPPSPIMTATQERQTRAPRRQVLRVDAQDGPWTVSVAENPHRPSSYTLYVKSKSLRLTMPPLIPPLAPHLPFRILAGSGLSAALPPHSHIESCADPPSLLSQRPRTTSLLVARRARSSSSITNSMTRIRMCSGQHSRSIPLRCRSL